VTVAPCFNSCHQNVPLKAAALHNLLRCHQNVPLKAAVLDNLLRQSRQIQQSIPKILAAVLHNLLLVVFEGFKGYTKSKQA